MVFENLVRRLRTLWFCTVVGIFRKAAAHRTEHVVRHHVSNRENYAGVIFFAPVVFSFCDTHLCVCSCVCLVAGVLVTFESHGPIRMERGRKSVFSRSSNHTGGGGSSTTDDDNDSYQKLYLNKVPCGVLV